MNTAKQTLTGLAPALAEDTLHYWIRAAALYEDCKAKEGYPSTFFKPLYLWDTTICGLSSCPVLPTLDCQESKDTFRRCYLHSSTEETPDMRKQFNTKEHHVRPNLANSTCLSVVDIFLLENNLFVKHHDSRVEFHKEEIRSTDYKKQKLLLIKFRSKYILDGGHCPLWEVSTMPCPVRWIPTSGSCC